MCVVVFLFSSRFVASVEVFGDPPITIKCPTLCYKIKLNNIEIPRVVQVLVWWVALNGMVTLLTPAQRLKQCSDAAFYWEVCSSEPSLPFLKCRDRQICFLINYCLYGTKVKC